MALYDSSHSEVYSSTESVLNNTLQKWEHGELLHCQQAEILLLRLFIEGEQTKHKMVRSSCSKGLVGLASFQPPTNYESSKRGLGSKQIYNIDCPYLVLHDFCNFCSFCIPKS